ncbi:anti-sigma factor [Cyclobacterium qasimii]|uniref:Anti-sigma factor n=2 Tax=Cyclobacterium qasimii TaxID=1350429 RepID=A0A512CIJ8_9BACT|nr:anti-sigma factor [Cyclobacterium qasimii]
MLSIKDLPVKNKFEELFKKYVDGSLSREEYEKFLGLLESDDSLATLDKELDKLWGQDQGDKRKNALPASAAKQSSRQLTFWGIAASLLLVVGFASWFVFLQNSATGFEEYHTDFGEVKELMLPDGSKVKLNANSTISWDKAWEAKGKRQIVLTGEAFFDIQSLPGKIPFVVETGEVSLEVIGTSFNVDNRSEKVEIYLDEGRLDVHLKDPEIEVIKMVPGDKVKVDPETNKVAKETNTSLINSASWKNGILNFKDMKLAEVLVKLTNIYGKTFVCENEALLDIDLYLGVPFADWDTVKQVLSLSLDIEFIENEDVVEIKHL